MLFRQIGPIGWAGPNSTRRRLYSGLHCFVLVCAMARAQAGNGEIRIWLHTTGMSVIF